MAATIELSGHDLAIDDVERVAVGGATAVLGQQGLEQIAASRALIDRVVKDGTPTYGVNTGFGRFVDVHIAPEQAARLQLNLLRSHACGVGSPFPDEVVRAATLLRANALAKGTSGVRVEPVRLLLDMLAAGVMPVVPSRGSLGASGDLRLSPIWASCSSGRGPPDSAARRSPGLTPSPGPGWSRSCSPPRRGSR